MRKKIGKISLKISSASTIWKSIVVNVGGEEQEEKQQHCSVDIDRHLNANCAIRSRNVICEICNFSVKEIIIDFDRFD